ncbi:MAG: IS256 family transposase [Planctomycetes bacterium]|nr:IS256 family transposase [Planctomycetota bacterium]
MLYDDDLRRQCQVKLWDHFEQRIRSQFKRLLEAFMEYERDQMLGCEPFERTPRRRGYRNGFQPRTVDTKWGTVLLRKPRIRGALAPFDTLVLERYQRRQRDVDEAVLQWLGCAMSTREVSDTLARIFGGALSAGGVSLVVARLDAQIRAFHHRSLERGYRYVYFDAKHGYVSHKRKRRGRGKKKKAALLLAWGVRHDEIEELIDFRVADSESEQDWTKFITELEGRGLRKENRWGQRLEMIVTDGAPGLLAALWMVYPTTPKQRCVFHKVQDITDHLEDRANRKAILASAGAIYQGLQTPQQANLRLARWMARWKETEPEAARNFAYRFDDTLIYLNAPPKWRNRLKTTNPIERLIQELNKKFRKAGVFPSAQSWERAAYIVWRKLQQQGYAPTARDPRSALFTHTT